MSALITPELWERLTKDTLHQIRWTSQQYHRASKPLVYVFWADEARTTALYVGKSKNGLGRPIDPTHHRRDVISTAAGVEFLICESNESAEALEAKLIRWLKPTHNIAHNASGIRGLGKKITRAKHKLKKMNPQVRRALEYQARQEAFYKR